MKSSTSEQIGRESTEVISPHKHH